MGIHPRCALSISGGSGGVSLVGVANNPKRSQTNGGRDRDFENSFLKNHVGKSSRQQIG